MSFNTREAGDVDGFTRLVKALSISLMNVSHDGVKNVLGFEDDDVLDVTPSDLKSHYVWSRK